MTRDLTGKDARAISGITLLLNILDELSDHKEVVQQIGENIDNKNLIGQIERIQAIIGTSGNREANQKLINSLKELNLELMDDFPHQESIDFYVHNVLACYYQAVGSHFQGWEEIRQETILKSLGSHQILDEPKLFRRSIFGKSRDKKKSIRYRRPEQLEYTDDFDDFDDDDFE